MTEVTFRGQESLNSSLPVVLAQLTCDLCWQGEPCLLKGWVGEAEHFGNVVSAPKHFTFPGRRWMVKSGLEATDTFCQKGETPGVQRSTLLSLSTASSCVSENRDMRSLNVTLSGNPCRDMQLFRVPSEVKKLVWVKILHNPLCTKPGDKIVGHGHSAWLCLCVLGPQHDVCAGQECVDDSGMQPF